MLYSCGSDKNTSTTSQNANLENINIRIEKDPQNINPFFAASASGREIYQYIFLSLADFHAETLELSPILIEEIPKGIIENRDDENIITYNMSLVPEAKWSDGQPITNKDIVFTYNMINHALSNASGWKPFFSQLKSVTADSGDKKKFSVSFDADYMLSLEAATTINLMPAHVYDPNGVITAMDIKDVLASSKENQEAEVVALFDKINASTTEKVGVVQSGPYSIQAYEPSQYLYIERQPDYWGTAYPDRLPLQANTKSMTFKVVADEATAITMLKDGSIDLIMMKTSEAFLDLKNDEAVNDKLSFHVPQLIRYYYYALNNKNPILSDKLVRQSLSHLIDVDDIIETIDSGLGERTIGPFHPSRSYYHDKLQPIPYSTEKAKALLDTAGWTDSDGDGIRDKIMNGKRVPLELDVLFTGSTTSRNMTLLFQATAATAGVKLNLVPKKMTLQRKENLYVYNYDISLLSKGTDLNTDDPYRRWHSDNSDTPTDNVMGYKNPQLDPLIEKVRLTRDVAEQEKYFHQIQEILYEDQPCIFLYCPLNKVVISNSLVASTTPKRPGYMANTFTGRKK